MTAVYDFMFEYAGISATDRHNREAFDEWRIIPRVLRNNTQRNVEVNAVISSIHSYG